MLTCPKCGGIMLPQKKGDKIVLRCVRCGYEMEASEEILKRHYRGVVKPSEKAKVKTTSKVSEAKPAEAHTKEELEQAKEEYYELVLEQMGDYGE